MPLLLSGAFTGACFAAAGPSLGLFIGGLLGVTLLAPAMALWRRDPLERTLTAGSVVDGAAIVWLIPVVMSHVTSMQWLLAYVLLAAYATAICGLAVALHRRGFSDVAANAVTLVLALLWLTWPIWLSTAMTSSLAAWLVPAHPPMAMNALLLHLGVWGEGRIAYQLTNLGQDVAYALPSSVLPAIILHALLGLALLLASRRRRVNAPVHQPDADPG